MSKTVAIIPARSGSKGVRDKNIRTLNGKPLIAYSIEHALTAETVERVIVSTDSAEYAEIAKRYGAEVPFLRPAEISGDSSLDIEVFGHVLNFLKKEGELPEILVHLRPTHPVRETSDIDKMVNILKMDSSLDSVRSVSKAPCTPYKMWLIDEQGLLLPVAVCGIPEAYNAPRQSLPQAYMQNACIDVVRSRIVIEKYSMTGDRIAGFLQDIDFDIDTDADFIRAEHFLDLKEKAARDEKLTVCFDIDGLIAQKSIVNDYSKALPNYTVIEMLNKLYSGGHEVILFTARGSATGIDWKQATKTQLASWNCHYSKLLFGKPAADIYLDDRFVSIGELGNYMKILFAQNGGLL
jgi:CMP-N-acetylneuraminic acid synthetase